jgi:hypothetical protein
MKQYLLTKLFFFFLLTTGFAQNRTYVGVEAAVTNDLYHIYDNGGGLKNVPLISGLWGFNVRKEISKRAFLEIGLLTKHYPEGIGFKIVPGYSGGSGETAILIPFRVGSKINLHQEKIHVVSVLGFSYGVISHFNDINGGSTGSQATAKGDTVYYEAASSYYRKNFPLIQGGIRIEFEVLNAALLSLSGDYYAGLRKLSGQQISYSVNSLPVQKATAESKGNAFAFGIAVSYRISRCWEASKE